MLIKRLSEQDFESLEAQWNDLHLQTPEATIFTSWYWNICWWQTWRKRLNAELLLLAAYEGEQLQAIVPFYYQGTGARQVKKIELIGNNWRGYKTVRSEYMTPLFNPERSDVFFPLLWQTVSKYFPAAKCFLSDAKDSPVTSSLIKYAEKKGYLCYVRSQDQGIVIKKNNRDFQAYLAQLGKNTRLQLFGRRKYIENNLGLLKVDILELNDKNVNDFFDLLNRFHELRWGKACFGEEALKFHKTLIFNSQCNPHWQVFLSVLSIAHKPVSVLYDIRYRDVRYNIQSGYLENFDNKLSLGTLHLGFAIESFFQDQRLARYDLLVGPGKHTDYKKRYNGESYTLSTWQCVYSIKDKALSRGYFLLPPRVRKPMLNFTRKFFNMD